LERNGHPIPSFAERIWKEMVIPSHHLLKGAEKTQELTKHFQDSNQTLLHTSLKQYHYTTYSVIAPK
jgi:hypothetical protein